MISFRASLRSPDFRADALIRNASDLATKVADSHANYLKISITRHRAIATGKTLQSVRSEFILDSPTRGQFRRSITAKNSWWFIQQGRKAGAKMPIKRVGTTSKGRPIFEPLPEMLEWFQALNIPRAAWFPILRAIKRRGIKPRDIQGRAMRLARTRTMELVVFYAEKIARELFVTPGGPVTTNQG